MMGFANFCETTKTGRTRGIFQFSIAHFFFETFNQIVPGSYTYRSHIVGGKFLRTVAQVPQLQSYATKDRLTKRLRSAARKGLGAQSCFCRSPRFLSKSGLSKIYGCFQKQGYPKMDGLSWKTLLKWMIWGAHPYFWKPPYV